jgi:hypothetical protein
MLYREQAGVFGGPDDRMFIHEWSCIAGSKERVPSIAMPTHFTLRYPDLKLDEDNNWVYGTQKGKSSIKTKIYGGHLTENLIQSLAFQLLMWQALLMEEHGVRVAGNNHDSFYCVIPKIEADKVAEIMEQCMSRVPDWLPGFPVACESKIGFDFSIC